LKKGQISVEILFSLGVVMLLFIIVMTMITDRNEQIRKGERYTELRETCFRVANLLTSIWSSETTNMSMRLYYNVTIEGPERSLFVTGKEQVFCSYPVSRVSNQTNTVFNLTPGYITFYYNNSYVVVRNT